MDTPTVASRLPKSFQLYTSHADGKTPCIAVGVTMGSADEARAVIEALEKAVIPMFEMLEAHEAGLPKSESF